MNRSRQHDTAIGRLAGRQHGVLTLEQALAAGVTRDAVRHRVERGTLVAVDRGVYRVAGAPSTWEQLAIAGVLACGVLRATPTELADRPAAILEALHRRLVTFAEHRTQASGSV